MACARPAAIAATGMEIRPGQVLIAPGDGHLLVRRSGNRLIAQIGREPAASGCLPSVDPMLACLAQACGSRALGLILSGIGRDGVIGARERVAAGGTIYAQDAENSAVWGMPGAVARAGLASLVACPEQLGAAIMAQVGAPLRQQG
jgi:two-component system chemotaxis response regulator CheB